MQALGELWVFLGWVVASVAVGVLAHERGRTGVSWGLMALVLSPLMAAVLLAAAKDKPRP